MNKITDHALNHMTNLVAEARQQLDEANAAHAEAAAEVNRLKGRIEQCQAHQSEITRKRLDGEIDPSEAAEFAALGGDINVLLELLADANLKATATNPVEARNRLARAEDELRRHVAEAEFQAVVQHAREVEMAYITCLNAVWDAAKQRGQVRTFGEAYALDPTITNLVRYNNFFGLGARP